MSSSSYTLHFHIFFFLPAHAFREEAAPAVCSTKETASSTSPTQLMIRKHVHFWMGFFFFSCLKREDKCLDNSEHNKGNNFPFIMYTDSFQIELILPPTACFLRSEYNHNTLQHSKQLFNSICNLVFNKIPCPHSGPSRGRMCCSCSQCLPGVIFSEDVA